MTKILEILFNMYAKSAFDTSYVALCPGTTFYPFREKKSFGMNSVTKY